MAWSYSPKNLGAGSIGGNGIWLIKQCSYAPGGGGYLRESNTHLNTERALADALTFNEQLPYIGGFKPLELVHGYYYASPDPYQDPVWSNCIYVAMGGNKAWVRHATFDGYPLMVYGPASTYETVQRHAHRVLYNNTRGTFVSSATRIQVGSSGYFDPLPGLFVIEPVPGTIVNGVSCDVTIKLHPNRRVFWQPGSTLAQSYVDMAYASVGHPYLRDRSNSITVSLATGNSNKHVIPGVSISFSQTPLAGDKCIISIGYEYVNARMEIGTIGETYGSLDYYFPQTDWGLQPYNTETYNYRDFQSAISVYATYNLDVFSKWMIYNVTGDVLEDCKFTICPFVRLDQGNAITPFDSWFMGYDAITGLPESSSPYTLTFSGYDSVNGRINLTCSYGVSMLIREIDPETFQPTGVTHSDGTGLKADGATLYRWDAVGVYFKIATTARNGNTALVYTKPGQEWEQYVKMTGTTGVPWSRYVTPWALQSGPTQQVIGGWDGITNSGTGAKYPISHCVPESRRTGILQTQGYDLSFFNASVHETNEHWYNHYFQVATIGGGGAFDADDNPRESAVMITSSDPRYFSVAPRRAQYVTGRRYGGTPNTDIPHPTANIGVPDTDLEIKLTGNIQERDGSLVLRVNQVDSDLMAVLEEAGVTVE